MNDTLVQGFLQYELLFDHFQKDVQFPTDPQLAALYEALYLKGH